MVAAPRAVRLFAHLATDLVFILNTGLAAPSRKLTHRMRTANPHRQCFAIQPLARLPSWLTDIAIIEPRVRFGQFVLLRVFDLRTIRIASPPSLIPRHRLTSRC